MATNCHVEKIIEHVVNPDNQCLVYDFDSIVAAVAPLLLLPRGKAPNVSNTLRANGNRVNTYASICNVFIN